MTGFLGASGLQDGPVADLAGDQTLEGFVHAGEGVELDFGGDLAGGRQLQRLVKVGALILRAAAQLALTRT